MVSLAKARPMGSFITHERDRVVLMHVLLVEPEYYTRYPPLGLLKLGSYHRSRGDTVELIRGLGEPDRKPDLIHVTSLFTYSWKPVHEAVRHYRALFPDVKIHLGGIYASLLPEHAKLSGADDVHIGLFLPAEPFMPAYDLIPQWRSSILFASRGCIRRCGFCSVPKLEGRPSNLPYGIRDLIYPGHKRIILWDNNILGNPNWHAIFDELIQIGLDVDFNQGLDARLLTEEVAQKIGRMRTSVIRLAYDFYGIGPAVKQAIECLEEFGVRGRKIVVYTLFNYTDSPDNFFERVRDLLEWGVVSYPMRYEPLTSLEKNKFVSPNWDADRLEMVADARRVMGFAGAFPPYKGLVKKFLKARNFERAFALRPILERIRVSKPSNALREQGADHEQLITVENKRPRGIGAKDWRNQGY